MSGLVVEEYHFLRELSEDLNAAILDSFIFFNVINVWICQLVCLTGLDKAETLAALVEPQIEQVLSHNLKLLKRVHYGCLLSGCGLHLFLFLRRS